MRESDQPASSANRPGASMTRTHHPGPPRFVDVGDSVELAPRNPRSDVAGTVTWTLVDRPSESTATVGDDPVVHLDPDEPGSDHHELAAPDGIHEQTVRAFPSDHRTARFAVEATLLPEDFETLSAVGPFNEFRLGHDRPVREDDEYVLDVPLPPGDHYAIFADDDFEHFQRVETTVDGPGRPRVHLDATVDGASPRRVVWEVVLPLSKAGLATVFIFTFLAGWTEFVVAQTVLSTDQYTLPVGLYLLVSEYSTPWPRFSAFALTFALPIMLVYLVSQRYIEDGLSFGGVEG